MHEHNDVATVQHLENARSTAYLRGDADFIGCLLTPDFVEVLGNGELQFLAYQLKVVAKNRGKNLAMPDLPKVNVLKHGNVAVAHAISSTTDSSGKPRTRRLVDFYHWEHGKCHAFFAQQPLVESH